MVAANKLPAVAILSSVARPVAVRPPSSFGTKAATSSVRTGGVTDMVGVVSSVGCPKEPIDLFLASSMLSACRVNGPSVK